MLTHNRGRWSPNPNRVYCYLFQNCMSLKIKALRFVLIVALALGALSCSKPEPIVVYGLTLSQNSVVFNAEGGEEILEVTPFPAEEPWALNVTAPEWATIEAVEGGVKVAVGANRSSEVRSAEFSIVSPEERFEAYVVTIAQEAAVLSAEEFSCSAAESYTFDSEGGSRTFTVVYGGEWSVECQSDWLQVEVSDEEGIVELTAEPNVESERKEATLLISYTAGTEHHQQEVSVVQQTREENLYYKLVGKWEITASKWFYSPNGSLNSLDYAPNAADYYLIFDIEEGVYGKSLVMRNFLYPGTALEVRYDSESGGFVIPFGWTVLAYDVFLYITVVNDSQFSYASLEVDAIPSEDYTTLSIEMPTVSGYANVGFGLWTYNDSGNKVALGSNYRPTLFPMNNITFRKHNE